jgi:hypothetical protein
LWIQHTQQTFALFSKRHLQHVILHRIVSVGENMISTPTIQSCFLRPILSERWEPPTSQRPGKKDSCW